MNILDRIKYEYNKGDSPLRKLIIINIAVFLSSLFAIYLSSMYRLETTFTEYFFVPSVLQTFLLRPWSILTYQFFHAGIWHLAMNMIVLYFFGRILLDFQSNKSFYTIYLVSGLFGAVIFILGYNIFPVLETSKGLLLGASGSVMGVVAATTLLVPDYEVRLFGSFNVRIKWIALYILLTGIIFVTKGNEGTRFAHFGGALFGALYMWEKQGRLNINMSWFKKIKWPFNRKNEGIDERDILRNRKAKHAYSNSSNTNSDAGNTGFSSQSSNKPNQEEIDAILDKISQSGYQSLNAEEKELLFRASE